MTTSSFVRPLMPEEFLPQVVEAFYKSTELFQVFGMPESYAGNGDSIRAAMNVGESSSNAAAVSEDGVLPDINESSHIELVVANSTVAVTGKISDEAIAEGRGTYASEISDRTADLINYVQSSLISTIESSVNSTGNYGGQTRTSYTAGLVSGYDSTNTGLTEAYMQGALEWLETPSIGSRRRTLRSNMVCLANVDMYYKMAALLGPAAGNPFVQGPGAPFDAGIDYFGGERFRWNGIEIIQVPSMTTGTVLLGDKSTIKIKETMPVEIVPLAKQNFTTHFAVRWRGNAINVEPSQWYRLIDKD